MMRAHGKAQLSTLLLPVNNPFPTGAYSVSKAGLIAFLKPLQLKNVPRNSRNLICPGGQY